MTVTRVLAAVVQRKDRYLICRRAMHKRHGGLWEFPGGKLEAGETPFDAARRELIEELAVRAVSVGPKLFSAADPGSEFVIEFVPTEIEGEPECLEHLGLSWVSLEELMSVPLAPSDRQFAQFLRSGHLPATETP
jgi:8-oxo-dGTP diphosphatase